jgi:hypothetical protein
VDYETARQAIYTRLKTAWDADYPTVPIQWENRLRVDLLQQVLPFISCDVVFDDGYQAAMEIDPLMRYSGCVHLGVYVREHEGTALQNTYLWYLGELFKVAIFSGVRTRAPVPQRPEIFEGWVRKSLRIEFWFDDVP